MRRDQSSEFLEPSGRTSVEHGGDGRASGLDLGAGDAREMLIQGNPVPRGFFRESGVAPGLQPGAGSAGTRSFKATPFHGVFSSA